MLALDGASLSPARIRDVARGGETVALTHEAVQRIATAHRQVAAVARRRPVYGRSTGVGANRTVRVDHEHPGHGVRLLRSHAAAGGPPVAREVVRAMLAVRLNQLAAGGSGVTPATAEGVARMLNDDALPEVREHGSVGTGDLAALAGTALTLLGERPASRSLAPVADFDDRDALPFMSSNALTLGRAALALADLEELTRVATVVAGLSFTAVHGNTEAFSPQAARATPFPGAATVAGWLRGIAGGRQGVSPRVQDPFGYRVFPQVHGVAVDAVAELGGVVATLCGTAQENPLVVTAGADEDAGVVHHGGFHMAGLSLRMDTARLALAQSAPALLGRVRTLAEPAFTGLPAFLAVGPPGSSGTMILEYVVGSAYASLRAAASPASLETVVLSRATEEDASFASLGARQLEAATAAYRTLVGCELLHAGRALALRDGDPPSLPSRPLSRAWARYARAVGHRDPGTRGDLADRDLQHDLDVAEGVLPALTDLLPPPSRGSRDSAHVDAPREVHLPETADHRS